MNQKIEFHYPDGYRHGDISRSEEGWHYSPEDTHFGKWIREAKDIAHDTGFLKWCCSAIAPRTTVVDIGANIGTHSVGYLRHHLAGSLICIEPFQTSFECLKRNLLYAISVQGRMPSVSCFCAAAGNRNGKIYLHEHEGNHGASFLSYDMSDREIDMRTLDSVVRHCGLVDISLIKIDAEGSEGEILLGAKEFVLSPKRYRPSIILEVNHAALERQGWSQDRLFDQLRSMDYTVLSRWPEEYNKLSFEQLKGVPQYDVHCVPI